MNSQYNQYIIIIKYRNHDHCFNTFILPNKLIIVIFTGVYSSTVLHDDHFKLNLMYQKQCQIHYLNSYIYDLPHLSHRNIIILNHNNNGNGQEFCLNVGQGFN